MRAMFSAVVEVLAGVTTNLSLRIMDKLGRYGKP